MTWTFDDALTSDRDKVRDLVGDTDDSEQQVSDESIALALSLAGSVTLASARIARRLMARYARRVTTSVGSYSEQMSDLYTHYKELAMQLESEANAGASVAVAWVDPTLSATPDGPIFTRHLHEMTSDRTHLP